ncbi:hypothetical protein [Geochorda subterranea]|uniref:Acetyltransferase (GNAT) family protein n=1 Tax=Geochorda subterranea TaxID=3109564 RepID=A0ABZ1BPJ5_9FIRM|nr:hypothetical protein [Limnochorda sp. LNt]WRP14712.1 hypothetical protein VLY81_00650 [Limnochorda sp. LNt]
MPLTGPGFDAVIDAYLATFGVPPDRPQARPDVGNTPARALYASKGWQVLLEPWHSAPDGEPYVILGLALPSSS